MHGTSHGAHRSGRCRSDSHQGITAGAIYGAGWKRPLVLSRPALGGDACSGRSGTKVACSGATPVGATNCLNFGNPEKRTSCAVSQTIDGITKACEELDFPSPGVTLVLQRDSGRGHLSYARTRSCRILEDVHKAAKMPFAATGRAIVLLRAAEAGDLADVESEFGSSEYAKEILGALWGYPPELELEREAALQHAVIELIQQRLVDSVHDCSDGGLAVALAEKAFPIGVGARVNIASDGLPQNLRCSAKTRAHRAFLRPGYRSSESND